jgi:hypothetical protein
MLPRQFPEAVGIQVDDQRPGSVRGVGGTQLIVHAGDADLELAHHGETLRWRANIRFASANHALLGQLGCLEFFIATFDHFHRFFELNPNERFPGTR